MTDTPEIRARIHDNAIKRVTRIYAATLKDIFNELLQNARRAGATRAVVTLTGSDDAMTATVRDDGAGVADPAVLLSFGENGWDNALVAREDAAGMGMLSLARRGCTISSRARVADARSTGQQVTLAPEHFLGETPALVREHPGAPLPHGTAVTFPLTGPETAETVRTALGNAARYYPLPVCFEHAPGTPSCGERLERRDFLQGATHVEYWQGVRFGIFRGARGHHHGLNVPDVNFHGLTVPVHLPFIETVHGRCWTAAADIVNCPDFELVLPTRKEAVETPFLDDMRKAARIAIYRAMAADPDPRPAFEDWKRARDAGIAIASPPAELRPWRPALADEDYWHEPPKPRPIVADPLRMDRDLEPPQSQALWRAAERTGMAKRMFAPDRLLAGYTWYDEIPRIVGLDTAVTVNGESHTLADCPLPATAAAAEAPLPTRPGAIRIQLTVQPPCGASHVVALDADLAFAGEAGSWIADALPLVTADSEIDPYALADIMRAAFFFRSDDADADSWDRQQELFDQEALHFATRLLVSDDEARRRSIAHAVERDISWLVPNDRDVRIAVRKGQITVTLDRRPA